MNQLSRSSRQKLYKQLRLIVFTLLAAFASLIVFLLALICNL